MKTVLAAASILMMTGVAAYATDDKAKSSGDAPAASGQNSDTGKMSPGTTGAMQNQAGGVATSPQDVQKQGGMATAPQTGGDDKSKAGGGDANKAK